MESFERKRILNKYLVTLVITIDTFTLYRID